MASALSMQRTLHRCDTATALLMCNSCAAKEQCLLVRSSYGAFCGLPAPIPHHTHCACHLFQTGALTAAILFLALGLLLTDNIETCQFMC